MISLVLMLLLSQEPCTGRAPGLAPEECTGWGTTPDGQVTCISACFYGKRPDGGTYGTNVKATAHTRAECRAKMEVKCSEERRSR